MPIFLRCVLSLVLFPTLVFAAQPADQECVHPNISRQAAPDADPTPTPPEQPKPGKLERLLLSATQQRGIVNQASAPPLSSREKFQLFWRSTATPYHFVAVGFDAAVSQAGDNFHGYGQGMEGFGKRYGASFADDLSSRFFGTYAYPSLFKEDPRYFRLGKGSIGKRILYAALQEFVAHRDGGGQRFNFSNPLGAVTAGAISNAYYPPGDRGFGLTMQRAGVSLAIGSGNQILKEFWPDIRRKILRPRKDRAVDAGPPPTR